MDIKQEVIRDITMKCACFVPSELMKKLEEILIMSLHDYNVQKNENALSTKVETPNERYIQRFIAIKKVNGLSERSLKLYYYEITRMFSCLNKPMKDITTDDIRYYLASEKMDKGISNCYLNGKLRCMKTFFKTMRIEGYVKKDPAETIPKIKSEKVIKKPFSDVELEKIRNEAGKDVRLKAIVEFMASTGCRVSEVAGANRTDIKDDKLIVTGKGNKERYVYLNARAKIALDEYFKTRTDDNEAMFVGKIHNSNGEIERITRDNIEVLVRKLGKRAGVENCHPHRFRRTMATQALKSGMPIEQVSLMLGHEDLSTTQIYARSDEREIHSSHQKYVH